MPARAVAGLPAPPPRSRPVPWRGVRYAALDFETTGLDFRTDTVVSFGVVPVEGGRALMRGAVHQLVDPLIPPSPRSQTIHELRPQDLAGSPTLVEARERLRDALAGRFLLVWFADVEVNLLHAIFGGGLRRWRRRTIDVRNLAIAVDGGGAGERDRQGYPLSGSAQRWGVPVANAHEALDDALVTAQLFLVLVPKLKVGGEPTLRDVLRAGRA
jgi:DNA polymerase III subunit epsilon